MAKSARHKKLRRQEKSKTHLKGVKKLLAAQNVVNPTLRVKKIVVPEQLVVAPDGQVATRRHQSLQELLSALNHHNTNMKKDALIGLQELVVGHRVLTHNLDKILERVAALTSDLESIVRRENLKLAELIFQRVEEAQMAPFWNLLLTHLKCTLTHLSPTVRYSTLSFFELLIVSFPQLVAGSDSIILPSLLGLISSSEATTGATSAGSSTVMKPRLKVEISGKHNDVRERLRVFTLIGSCLRLKELSTNKNSSLMSATQEMDSDDKIDIFSSSSSNLLSEPRLNNQEINANKHKQKYLGLYYPMGYDSLSSGRTNKNVCLSFNRGEDAPVDILGTDHQYQNSVAPGGDENQFWPRFVEYTLSILTETWVEAASSNSVTGSASGSQEPKQTKKKPGFQGMKQKQEMSFNIIAGNDKTSNDVVDRQNENQYNRRGGSGNLSPSAVESLSCILHVMIHLVLPQGEQMDSSEVKLDKCLGDSDEFMRMLRKNHGTDLNKYFFAPLPYAPVQDSQRGIVNTHNLQLFRIAARLRLMDAKMMERLDGFINDLVNGQTLDSPQVHLILQILGFVHLPNRRQLTTNFMTYILDQKSHWGLICKFLERILQPENRNPEEMFLVQNIDWEVVTSKLLDNFDEINTEFVNLLTCVALRKLSSVKSHLMNKITTFRDLLHSCPTVSVWEESIRLFYYADAFPEFTDLFSDKIPPLLKDSLNRYV